MRYRLLTLVLFAVLGINTSAKCTHPIISPASVATPDATGQQITFRWTSDSGTIVMASQNLGADLMLLIGLHAATGTAGSAGVVPNTLGTLTNFATHNMPILVCQP